MFMAGSEYLRIILKKTPKNENKKTPPKKTKAEKGFKRMLSSGQKSQQQQYAM